jgi:hypothetical protein
MPLSCSRGRRGQAKGGPRGATELFLRSVAGDDVYESLDPELRERLLGNAEALVTPDGNSGS